MKRVSKSNTNIFNKKVTLTVDEKLNDIKLETLAPHKLEQANKDLRNMKSLPKLSKNS